MKQRFYKNWIQFHGRIEILSHIFPLKGCRRTADIINKKLHFELPG